jgi:glycogen(starch) synthase
MKIVIASYGFLPAIGGVSTTVAIQASEFAKAGHDVTVVTLDPGPTEGYGHRVVRRPGPLTLFRLYMQADVLILANLSLQLIYPLVILRKPFGLQHHSESAFKLSRSLFSMDLLRRAVLPRARHFMTSAFIGRKSGFPRYVVTHPFSSSHNITPEVVRAPNQRADALFVGRLEPEKGVMWMLERWPRIREALGVEKLRVVGAGSLSAAIESMTSAGQLPGVDFVGPLSGPNTAREMGAAAYVLVPSLWEEPFGAVALEGLTAGAITVLTNRGGLTETTGDLGVFFDPDDEASFDAALKTARQKFDLHRQSTSAHEAYRRRVASHVASFKPSVVVAKILHEMAP